MKLIKKLFIVNFLFLSGLFSTNATAQSPLPPLPFHAQGKILSINNSRLNLSDLDLRLLSTVKVILENNKKGDLNDVKPGDYAGVTFITLDKKQYVDTIKILADKPSLNMQDKRLP